MAGTVSVTVSADVSGEPHMEQAVNVPIPPDYTDMDTAALTVRLIEDTAFALTRQEFDRRPTLDALRAAVARLIGIERVLDEPDGPISREDRIRAIIALSNAEAIDTYGEPEGED